MFLLKEKSMSQTTAGKPSKNKTQTLIIKDDATEFIY